MTQHSIPVLGKPSFSCPHCGAIAHQDWYKLRAAEYDKDRPPHIVDASLLNRIHGDRNLPEDQKQRTIEWAIKALSGKVFLEEADWENFQLKIHNLCLSRCFSCEEVSVWVHGRIFFPNYNFQIAPNEDLPDEIKADFVEAMQIFDISPRGSAALLRLCVQKLCKHLGKAGKNINDDIADLVKDGLDVRIQKSLDIVRVIGNNAVHPGLFDMTDNKDIASRLFRLVNMIADAMITQPKHIDEFYETLPENTKAQIEKRDSKARG